MATSKSKFSIDQQKAAGRKLKSLRAGLAGLAGDLSRSYAVSSRPYQQALACVAAVDQLRKLLDRHARRESGENQSAYYAGSVACAKAEGVDSGKPTSSGRTS